MKNTKISNGVKLLFLPLVIIGLAWASTDAKAITIVFGPNAQEVKDRYAGSILIEDNHFGKNYWYVEPVSQERYLLKSGVSVSLLLDQFGQAISNKDLNKIPTDTSSPADYNFAYKMRGRFLIQTEAGGQAWYVNPIDNLRYAISDGKNGLATLQKLGLDISPEKLIAIPTAKNINFAPSDTNQQIDFSTYDTLKSILKGNYYKKDKINDSDLFYGSLQGMASSLGDPYTEFFTPQGKTEFDNWLDSSVEGIGAVVDSKDGQLFIVSPLENSPAYRADLQPGDQILKVNGTSIKGYAMETSLRLIKGPQGTTVKLEIYRPSTDKTWIVEIVREKISIPSVTGKILNGNIAYFKINIFSQDVPQLFASLQKQLIDSNTRGIIVDLRNNPGGYTSSALNLADFWLPANELLLEENYPDKVMDYTSQGAETINIPTVILINEGSASASEIFTLALKAHQDNLKIVGHQSFGKGTGQTLEQFVDGSAIKYTIFEWFDPTGTSVEGKGITPDYIVDNKDNYDWQLQQAETLLK